MTALYLAAKLPWVMELFRGMKLHPVAFVNISCLGRRKNACSSVLTCQ